jgi:HSP20 family molecular chaperone IbpA
MLGGLLATATLIGRRFGRSAGLGAVMAGAGILAAGWLFYFHASPPSPSCEVADLKDYLASFLYKRGCTVRLSDGITPEWIEWRSPERPILPGCPQESGKIRISKQSSPEAALRFYQHWAAGYVVPYEAILWGDVILMGSPQEISSIRVAFPSSMSEHLRDLGFDIDENENEYIVRAKMPGFKSEDIDIQVSGNVLTIKAEKKGESKEKKDQGYFEERRLERAITLPAGADVDKVDASYWTNGILVIRLAKTEDAKRKGIAVQGDSTIESSPKAHR